MVQQRKYYFQGVPNQVGKLQKFLGVWRCDKKPLEGKFQGVEGSKAKVPSVGRRRYVFFFTLHNAYCP